MRVLGIESSCDETAAAIVTDQKELLSSIVFSQAEPELFGGVVPEIAARAHLQKIGGIVQTALDRAGFGFKDLDAVAASAGAGLIGGVIVGVFWLCKMGAHHHGRCRRHRRPCRYYRRTDGQGRPDKKHP